VIYVSLVVQVLGLMLTWAAATKLVVGMNVGINTASLCINRRPYNVATIKSGSKIGGSVSEFARL
jgi:hypothetical protein